MKNLFLIRALSVFIPFSLCVFTGCEMPYSARIGADGPLAFREDFLKANRIYGAFYMDENGKISMDQTSPEYRTYIITDKAQMDEIFSVCPDIDFEKEMVVMYAFTSIYNGRQLKISRITLGDKNLKIEFKYERGKPFHNDASSPQIRFFVIRMDKLDIETVEFNLLNP